MEFEGQTAMDRQWILQREELDRRFYKNLNEIRAYLGMPPIDYLGDSFGSGSTAILDHGRQDEEKNYGGRPAEVEALIAQDSRSGPEYEASTVSKIQMESPIVLDSTEIINREEIEGQPFDFVDNLPAFKTDEPEELRQVEKIAIPNGDIGQVISADVKCESSRAGELKKPSSPENGDPTICWGINIDSERPALFKEFRTELDVGASSQKLIVEPKENPEVITYPLEIVVEVESDEIYGWADYRTISVETLGNSFAHHVNLVATEAMISDFKGKSVECLEVPIAPKVFVEMPGLCMVERGTNVSSWVVELSPSIDAVIGKRKVLNENSIFDPGIASLSSNLSIPKSLATTCGSCSWKILANPHMGRIKTMSLVFDPGGVLASCHYMPRSSYWIARVQLTRRKKNATCDCIEVLEKYSYRVSSCSKATRKHVCGQAKSYLPTCPNWCGSY